MQNEALDHGRHGKKTGKRVCASIRLWIDKAAIRKPWSIMTQKEFSESFSIPLSTLRQWEQGKRVPHIVQPKHCFCIIAHDSETAIKALHH